MSWINGALQGVGFLTDMASTVSNIVTHQQQLDIQRQQLAVQRQGLALQEQLAHQNMALSWAQTVRGPAEATRNLMQMGYSPLEARQLMGSRETVSLGGVNIGPRVSPFLPLPQVEPNRHLNQMTSTLHAFQAGAPFTWKPGRGSYDVQRIQNQQLGEFVPRRGSTDA